MQHPAVAVDSLSSGVEHHRAGRLGAAIDAYSQVLRSSPDCGDAWRLLAIAALQSGRRSAARASVERALAIDADDAAAQAVLGAVHEAEGDPRRAFAAYLRACALAPHDRTAVMGLLRTALTPDEARAAIAAATAALAAIPPDAALLRALGAAHLAVRGYDSAADACAAAAEREPHPDAYANAAAALIHLERIPAAIEAAQRALRIDPAHAGATLNLGIARKFAGDFPGALAAFERAVELGSDAAHLALGTTLLLLGDHRGGWPHFGALTAERRRIAAELTLPLWDGNPAPGKRLLIRHEQGIGDTLQMARFFRAARERVGSVTVVCPPELIDVLRTADGVDACGEPAAAGPLTDFDLWLPTLRLPVVLDADPSALDGAPYLRADPQRAARWRARLEAPGRLRVGLVWSGNPAHEWDGLRSCSLADLEPLRTVEGVAWFALQQGAGRDEQRRSPFPLRPVNAEVVDFADTAAIVAQLDLVITVDTSVAHLTGALGRRVWVLLPQRPDWRWGLDGERSSWYPSLRLFRQPGGGGWAPPVAAAAAALRELQRVSGV